MSLSLTTGKWRGASTTLHGKDQPFDVMPHGCLLAVTYSGDDSAFNEVQSILSGLLCIGSTGSEVWQQDNQEAAGMKTRRTYQDKAGVCTENLASLNIFLPHHIQVTISSSKKKSDRSDQKCGLLAFQYELWLGMATAAAIPKPSFDNDQERQRSAVCLSIYLSDGRYVPFFPSLSKHDWKKKFMKKQSRCLDRLEAGRPLLGRFLLH